MLESTHYLQKVCCDIFGVCDHGIQYSVCLMKLASLKNTDHIQFHIWNTTFMLVAQSQQESALSWIIQ